MMDDEEQAVRKMMGAIKKVSDELKQSSDEEDERNSISSHYGVKVDVFKRMIADIMSDVFFFDNKSGVLDKHFKKFNAEDRLRVEAYAASKMLIKGAERNYKW